MLDFIFLFFFSLSFSSFYAGNPATYEHRVDCFPIHPHPTAITMEDQLAQVLSNTLQPSAEHRMQAELELKQIQANPAYPVSLAKVAGHASIETNIRQAALTSLRQFIENNWAADEPGVDPPIPIADEVRNILRQSLLDLALTPEDDRKAKIAAR